MKNQSLFSSKYLIRLVIIVIASLFFGYLIGRAEYKRVIVSYQDSNVLLKYTILHDNKFDQDYLIVENGDGIAVTRMEKNK